MRHFIIASILILALGSGVSVAGPKHHRTSNATEAVSDTSSSGIEAYSDTSSAYTGGNSSQAFGYGGYDNDSSQAGNGFSPADYSDPISWYGALWGLGAGGVLLGIFLLLIALLFFLLPVIVVILIIRYLFQRGTNRDAFAGRAADQAQPMPKNMTAAEADNCEMTWRRGIKNVAVGVGLMFMFYFMDADALIGVGLLVACIGGGQMFMARTSAFGTRRDAPMGENKFYGGEPGNAGNQGQSTFDGDGSQANEPKDFR